MVSQKKLQFWIQNGYNVLFSGKHGVGKTSIIKQAFNDAGLNWLYFSAATMDPWVDFIGVPKERILEDGTVYLDLIRPLEFARDNVEALFFDEYNRALKKVRNAIMELIQFRSINGKKFNNLKVIWAAVNPSDDEDDYDVEEIDPAQLDRFQIKVDIPYKPSLSYFSKKYNKETAKAAISWWDCLPNNIKKVVSPRRLDYALDVLNNDGDVRDVLPIGSNVTKFITTLKVGPIEEKLKDFMEKDDRDGAKKFLANENNFMSSKEFILRDKNINFFLPTLSKEKFANIISNNKKVFQKACTFACKNKYLANIIREIYKADQNNKFTKWVKAEMNKNRKFKSAIVRNSFDDSIESLDNDIQEVLKIINEAYRMRQTYYRKKAHHILKHAIFDTMEEKRAIKVLKILNKIASKTAKHTLKNWGFEHTIKICVQAIAKDTNAEYNEVLNKLNFHNIFNKIKKTSLMETEPFKMNV